MGSIAVTLLGDIFWSSFSINILVLTKHYEGNNSGVRIVKIDLYTHSHWKAWMDQIVHSKKITILRIFKFYFLASHYKVTSNSRLSWNNVYLLDVLGEMLRQVTRPEFDQFRGSVTDKDRSLSNRHCTVKKVLTDELEFCETWSHNVNKMRQTLKLFSLFHQNIIR